MCKAEYCKMCWNIYVWLYSININRPHIVWLPSYVQIYQKAL